MKITFNNGIKCIVIINFQEVNYRSQKNDIFVFNFLIYFIYKISMRIMMIIMILIFLSFKSFWISSCLSFYFCASGKLSSINLYNNMNLKAKDLFKLKYYKEDQSWNLHTLHHQTLRRHSNILKKLIKFLQYQFF